MDQTFDISQMEENAGQATAFLKALSHPKRLMVLCNLVDGELTSGDLAEKLDISHPNLSQHLAKLKAENLVASERSATTMTYRIADPRVAQIIGALQSMFCPPEDPGTSNTSND